MHPLFDKIPTGTQLRLLPDFLSRGPKSTDRQLDNAVRKGDLDRIKHLLFGENIRTKLTEAQAVSLLKLAISHRRTNALNVLLGLGEDPFQYSKQPDEWPWVFRSTLPSHGVSLLLQAFDEYKMADSEISKTVIALATAADQQLAGRDSSFDSRALVNCRLLHRREGSGRGVRLGGPFRGGRPNVTRLRTPSRTGTSILTQQSHSSPTEQIPPKMLGTTMSQSSMTGCSTFHGHSPIHGPLGMSGMQITNASLKHGGMRILSSVPVTT